MRTILRIACLAMLLATNLYASINGSISGIVTDPSGAVVTGATITAINTQTGIKSTTQTDDKGFYSFPSLPIGTYDVQIQETGFKSFTKSGLVLDANSALRAGCHVASRNGLGKSRSAEQCGSGGNNKHANGRSY
ncbi:MAG: hypothetical protein JWO91_445 [Acidobacteriaceae bacterium]|jgi:hypothetical protein|nr:hypothetical protein [Acidobacteriaceae bacterium]